MPNKAKLAGFRAWVFEDEPLNVRAWIHFLSSQQIDAEVLPIATDIEHHKQSSQPPHFVIINANLLAKGKVSLTNFIKRIDIDSSQVIVYPKWTVLAKSLKEVNKINWPLDEKGRKQLVECLEDRLSTKKQGLIKNQDIIDLLRPFLVFRSKIMVDGLALLPKIAQTQYNVLISGATGTGKEMVAKAIHHLSAVAEENFVVINSAAIAENLLESELFGHVKGSFTGAIQDQAGKFKLADRGTLFLDEIGDMPLNMQVKLLRAIEEKKIYPVGSQTPIEVDVRLIAATQVDLAKAVKEGKFREDLYYRLNVLSVHLPPLSKRVEDISLLAWHFLSETAKELNLPEPYPVFTPQAIELLENYHWAGNVRQLKNFITKVVATLDEEVKRIKPSHLLAQLPANTDLSLQETNNNQSTMDGIFIPWGTTIDEAKKIMLDYALAKTGSITKTADTLGMSTRHVSRLKSATKKQD